MDVQAKAIRTARDIGDRAADDLHQAFDRAGFNLTVTATPIVDGRPLLSVEAIPLDKARRLTARLLLLREVPRD